MKETGPLLGSLIIHASLAWVAFNAPQYFQFYEEKESIKPVYTMEMLPAPVNTPRPAQTTPPKKEPLVTQQQESPVKVVQAEDASPKKAAPQELATELENLKEIQLPEKDVTTVSSEDPSTLAEPLEQKPQRGGTVAQDGRFLRPRGGNRPPLYPISDRLSKKTGRVTVIGYIDNRGNVSNVRIERSRATRQMEINAARAFSKYRFQEGQEGWVKMPFEFTLEGEGRVISVRETRLLRKIQ